MAYTDVIKIMQTFTLYAIVYMQSFALNYNLKYLHSSNILS